MLELIEREVERQDIHGGLSEQAELAWSYGIDHELVDGGFRQSTLMGDAGDLVEGCGGSDVWIETGA